MRYQKFDDWLEELDLYQTEDSRLSKPVYRKRRLRHGNDAAEIDVQIGASLRHAREARDLPQKVLASMLGLSHQVYRRYENGVSSLTASRLLHVCEILGTTPNEVLLPVAPYLWRQTNGQGNKRVAIAEKLESLDPDTLEAIDRFLQQMTGTEASGRDNGEDGRAAQAALLSG